jgi:hypothetical protein
MKQLDKLRARNALSQQRIPAVPPTSKSALGVEDLQRGTGYPIGFASYDGYGTAATLSVQDRLGDLTAVA